MSYSLIRENTRIARHAHECIWCPELIEAREKYVDEISVYDGQWQHRKWHPECAAAFETYCSETGEDLIYPHECKRGTNEHV